MTKDDKREAIIQAASEQFRQYGYRKTAMDDISKRMGISRASLYSYFDNKDEIFGTGRCVRACSHLKGKIRCLKVICLTALPMAWPLSSLSL